MVFVDFLVAVVILRLMFNNGNTYFRIVLSDVLWYNNMYTINNALGGRI